MSETPIVLNQDLSDLSGLYAQLVAVINQGKTLTSLTSPHNVITIDGARGAGKTTLLSHFCDKIEREGLGIVLPAIQPEFFASGDNIYGSVLTRFRTYLDERRPAALKVEIPLSEAIGGTQTVDRLLTRLIRYAGMVADPSGETIMVSSLDQYSSDFARQAFAGETFLTIWRSLVAGVSGSMKQGNGALADSPPIVIPVDDPDLRPELLTGILQNIRTMSWGANVVFCVCLDMSEARVALISNYYRVMNSTAGADAQAVVESTLAKALPERWRFGIQELSPRERLNFRPLYQEMSLGAVLRQYRIAIPGSSTVEDLFWVGDQTATSKYAECLPSLPREIETLYHRLLRGSDRPSQDPVASVAILLAEASLRSGFRRTPHSELRPELLIRIEEGGNDNTKPTVNLDFGSIDYLANHRRAQLLFRPNDNPTTTIQLGWPSETIGRLHGEGAKNPGPRVADATTFGLLLLREFTQGAELMDEQIEGGEPVKGGRPSEYLNLRVGADLADRQFLIPPPWTTHYDYWELDRGWRAVLDLLSSHTRGFGQNDPQYVHAPAVLMFLQLVSDVQLERRAKPDRYKQYRYRSDNSPNVPELLLEEQWEAISSSLARCLEPFSSNLHDSPRDSAFLRWIQLYLPYCCHPALLPQSVVEKIMGWRSNMLLRVGRLATGDAELTIAVTRRLRARLGEEWTTPLYEVFEFLAPDEIGPLYESHQDAIRQRGASSLIPRSSVGIVDPRELSRRARDVLRDMRADLEMGSEE